MRLKWVARLGAAVLVVAICASLLAWAERGHWRLALLAHLRPQYALALGFGAIGSAAMRRWPWFWMAAGAWLINAGALWPQVSAPREEVRSRPANSTLRVLTFNLLQGNSRYDEVLAYVRRENADVVALQEVTRAWAKALAPLHVRYPHALRREVGQKIDSILLLGPEFDPPELMLPRPEQANSTLLCQTRWRNRDLYFAVLHPLKPTTSEKLARQQATLAAVAAWAKARPTASGVIALGDMNTTPWSHSFRDFLATSGLRDTSRGRIFEATWHFFLPDRLMLDHIFVSKNLGLSDRRIGPDLGSDHRPVVAELSWP